ncbi:armadillo repeat-containing protein [Anaeramoeba flamelloides]|uniref:Armadillo repeat-containing protein n=1 Tax=Anaeramoeba flamelloides TaxID=1746091 RepID=A0AAV7Y784_9EUKA|nr:armadillo repeat-containing protein [Anaeramoeba flamelloides]
MDSCKKNYKCFLESDRLKLIGIAGVGIGIGYAYLKQAKSIKLRSDEPKFLKTLQEGDEEQTTETLQQILERINKSKDQKEDPFKENFKAQSFGLLIKSFTSENKKISSSASLILSKFLNSVVYCNKLETLEVIEILISKIKELAPLIKEESNQEYLNNYLKLFFKIVKIGQKKSVLRIVQNEGVPVLGALLKKKEINDECRILILKNLTWCCEFYETIPLTLEKQEILMEIKPLLDSSNEKIVEYSTSLINDYSKNSELCQRLENLGLVKSLVQLIFSSNNDQILCNASLSLTKLMVDRQISDLVCIQYEIVPQILVKLLRSKDKNLNYCGCQFLEIAAKASVSNKVLIRECGAFPILLSILNKKGISQKLLERAIAAIKELIVQSTRTNNVKYLRELNILPVIISIFKDCTNQKMKLNLVIIIGNFSCSTHESRIELMKTGVLSEFSDLLLNSKDIILTRNLVTTFANLLISLEVQKELYKIGGIATMLRSLESTDNSTQYGALIGLKNLFIYMNHDQEFQNPKRTKKIRKKQKQKMFILPQGITVIEGKFNPLVHAVTQGFHILPPPSNSLIIDRAVSWLQEVVQNSKLTTQTVFSAHCLYLLNALNVVLPCEKNQIKICTTKEEQSENNLNEFIKALKRHNCPHSKGFPKEKYLEGDGQAIKQVANCILWLQKNFENNGIIRESSLTLRTFSILKISKDSHLKNDRINPFLLDSNQLNTQEIQEIQEDEIFVNIFYLEGEKREEILKQRRFELGQELSDDQSETTSDFSFFGSDESDESDESELNWEQVDMSAIKKNTNNINNILTKLDEISISSISPPISNKSNSESRSQDECEDEGEKNKSKVSDQLTNETSSSESELETLLQTNEKTKTKINNAKTKNRNKNEKFNEQYLNPNYFENVPHLNTLSDYLVTDLSIIYNKKKKEQKKTKNLIPSDESIYLVFFILNTLDKWKTNNREISINSQNGEIGEFYDELTQECVSDTKNIGKLGEMIFPCQLCQYKNEIKNNAKVEIEINKKIIKICDPDHSTQYFKADLTTLLDISINIIEDNYFIAFKLALKEQMERPFDCILRFSQENELATCLSTILYFIKNKSQKNVIGYNPPTEEEVKDFSSRVFPILRVPNKKFLKLMSSMERVDMSSNPKDILKQYYENNGVNFLITIVTNNTFPLAPGYIQIRKKKIGVYKEKNLFRTIPFSGRPVIYKSEKNSGLFRIQWEKNRACRASTDTSVTFLCKRSSERSLISRSISFFASNWRNNNEKKK